MNILRLLVKAKSFERLASGQQKEELREISASTQDKFVVVTESEVTIKLYDAICFCGGNEKNAPEVLIKVEDTALDFEPDDEGYIQLYEEDGKLLIAEAEIYYKLGEILETKNLA